MLFLAVGLLVSIGCGGSVVKPVEWTEVEKQQIKQEDALVSEAESAVDEKASVDKILFGDRTGRRYPEDVIEP